MPPEHVNRGEVRERVARLLDEYGRDGVCVTTVREGPEDDFDRSYAPEWRARCSEWAAESGKAGDPGEASGQGEASDPGEVSDG